MMSLSAFLSSCSKYDEEQGETIVLDMNTSTRLTAYADDIKVDGNISFQAYQYWTAVVRESVTGGEESELDWLSLSLYEGVPGEYSITIYLTKNLTGEDRTATITIKCGDTEKKFTVVQLKDMRNSSSVEEKDGGLMKSFEFSQEGRDDRYGVSFFYDNECRVIKLVLDGWSEDGNSYVYSYDYSTLGVIQYSYSSQFETYKFRAVLNEQGNVFRIDKFDTTEENYVTLQYFEYDENERLQTIYYVPEEAKGRSVTLTYTDSLITHVKNFSPSDPNEENYEWEFPIHQTYPNRIENISNIDCIWAMELFEGDCSLFYMMGLLGKRSSCLPELIHVYGDEYETEDSNCYTTPNETVHKVLQSKKQVSQWRPATYTLKQSGLLESCEFSIPYLITTTEFDVYVGNDLLDPENPEAGYTYKIPEINKTTKKLDIKYTISCTYY